MSSSPVPQTGGPVPHAASCEACPVHRAGTLSKLGINVGEAQFVVALAGNPNTGKSTIFNALTGLRQHTGNWPGKTVTRAEGGFAHGEFTYKLVDLPGTYSLLSTSTDEEIARNFILFGRPDVTVIVVDATRLERNLNLALQILEITDRAVVCLNLMDEARRHQLEVDARSLARSLGVPVVATSARFRRGLDELLAAIEEVATGRTVCRPHRVKGTRNELRESLNQVVEGLTRLFPRLPNPRWVALRLLDGDEQMREAVQNGELAKLAAGTDSIPPDAPSPQAVRDFLTSVETIRFQLGADFQDQVMESIYTDAAEIAERVVRPQDAPPRRDVWATVDRLVTSRLWGFPIMLGLLTLVFWLTISGANVPSSMLSTLLIDQVYPWLKSASAWLGTPWWIEGVLVDGMYLATAWVVSVMLPPMAIFFPLFTLAEDLGYLPRVAFNLDHLFKRVGAHGKQALTMSMGFGCNAAGVIATRIIDSPRERLIAIITNNFALCNGRWPTQILIASLFIGSLAPDHWAGLVSALAVVGVALLGIFLSLVVSWFLSRTMLRGEVSSFTLELPPYRPPRILQTIYTSLIDRTIFVLWRAVLFALPAGAVIWLISNISVSGRSLAEHLIAGLDPLGSLLGLNGVILLAYVVAIPANEIVIPTILMLTVLSSGVTGMGAGAGVLFEVESASEFAAIFSAGGWTLLTAVNLMLFSLIHNPCSTTIYTIYKETGSRRWTAVAALLPVVMGLAVTFLVARVAGWMGG
ncbi:MAG: ferrous iron transport protein B [Acidobacteriota bacterium]